MSNLPNLAGVATSDLVEKIGAGKFSASYINWSRTVNLLRIHAPGWLPETVPNVDGGMLHRAPVGAYLMIRFRNGEIVTPPVPQAIMDARNASIPLEKITARDITDTHRRGVCMAAAMTFGLAYELWAKMPLESGYAEPQEEVPDTDPMILDGLREAAMLGVEALRKAYKNHLSTKTPGFPEVWKANGEALTSAAKEADEHAAAVA